MLKNFKSIMVYLSLLSMHATYLRPAWKFLPIEMKMRILSFMNFGSDTKTFCALRKVSHECNTLLKDFPETFLINYIAQIKDERYKRLPLVYAAKRGDVKGVKRLLACESINVNRDNGHKTPLYYACRKGHVEIVKLLLNHKDVYVNRSNWRDTFHSRSESSLYCAVLNRDIEIVTLLLAHKDINIDQGIDIPLGQMEFEPLCCQTPIKAAVECGYTEIVKLFVNHKNFHAGMVNCTMNTHSVHWLESVFEFARRKGFTEIAQLLTSKKVKR